MVRLRTLDGVEFVLDQMVAFQSELIKDMINDCPDENQDMPIPLPNVRSEILTKVIEFCEYHRPDRQPLMKPKPPPAIDQTTTAKWLDQNTAANRLAAAVKLLGPLATVPVNYGTLACVPCALTDALGDAQDTPGGSGSGAGAGLLSVPAGERKSISLGPEDSASQVGYTQPTAEASGSGSGNKQGDIVKANEEVVERSRTDSLAPEMSTSVVLGPEDSASRIRVGDASGSGNQDYVGVMEVDGEKNMGKDQGDGSGAVEGGHVNLDVDMNKDNKTGSLSGGAGSGERAGEGVAEENPSETVFQTSLEAQGSFKGDSDGMKADTNKGPAKEASKENNGGKAGIDADMEPPPAGSTSTETNDNAPAVQDAGNLDPPQPDKEEEKVEMIPMNEAEEALADKEWDKNFIDVGQDMLFSLILTANFLYIPALLELGLSTVGAAIKGKPPGEVRQMYGMPDDFDPYRPLPRSSFKSANKVKSRPEKKARTKAPNAGDEEDDDMDVDDGSEEETPPPVVLPPQRGTKSRPVRASRKAVDYTFAGDEVE